MFRASKGELINKGAKSNTGEETQTGGCVSLGVNMSYNSSPDGQGKTGCLINGVEKTSSLQTRNQTQGCRDGSVDKVFAAHAERPAFDLLNPCKCGRRELTPRSYPPTSIHIIYTITDRIRQRVPTKKHTMRQVSRGRCIGGEYRGSL